MLHVLDTTRIFRDEDTNIVRTIRCAMPYCDLCGPIEDMTYIFPDYPHVTGFRDEVGELVMVLEPFQKVLDGWLLYLEQGQGHKPISFSSQ